MEEKKRENNWIIMKNITKSTDYEGFIFQEKFKEVISDINKKLKKSLISPLVITLGDEFQGVSNSLKNSTLIIIHLEEY